MVMRTEDILGYPVAAVSLEACVDALMMGIDAATGGDVGPGGGGSAEGNGPHLRSGLFLACVPAASEYE